jgi:succinate-semialdehyde dehydrogenase/glutarate-semialdehyde dehydrogenase
MAAFDEETFGPLAPVIEARDEAHAVELANASRFGLGASVWTGDPARGAALAPAIEAGAVFVNGIVKSDPRLPFGGIKASGFGRELAAEGIRAFTDVKTVWVR